ncbi:MAG: hypothetical protein LUQ11_07485 [Methylococcaceae bacterium]|nr:hypothetical protein [Methylococcaceae bacterium]
MKERITVRKLMQEGWIPVLTGALSAAAILSLEYSTGMVYLTAFLLMALYFVAIAANRVNAKVVVAGIAKRILQQAILKGREVLHAMEMDKLAGNVLSLCSMQINLARHHIGESIAGLNDGFSGLMRRVDLMLSRFIGIDIDGLIDSFRKSKIALDKIVQSFKSLA